MSSLVPLTFNKVALQVVTVDSKDWCRAKKVWNALEYEKKTENVIKEHFSCENIGHKCQLSMKTSMVTTIREHCCNVMFL